MERCNKILEQESCKIGKIIARGKIWQDFGTNLVTSCHFLPLLARILQDFFDGEWMPDLRRLKAASLSGIGGAAVIPDAAREVRSPLRGKLHVWKETLLQHPNRELAEYVLEGIEKGFRIGFNHQSHRHLLQAAGRNMPSAGRHADVISDYLREETTTGRITGPFPRDQFSQVHVNRFGVIPKSTPGKWRLITDLSFPQGHSVNDGVDAESCSMRYTTVENFAVAAMECGRGALLAKVDIRAAYRHVAVHPDDRYLLGVVWDGALYIDCMLPFGLRSAPKVFNVVADTLEWMMRVSGVQKIDHYLDDFATYGAPYSEECAENLAALQSVAEGHGISLARDKTVGPSTRMVFLGIEIDTVAGTLRLPSDKLAKLQRMLQEWAGKKSARKRDLQVILGHLNHACKVIRPGRSFLRNMIALLKVAHSPAHHIRLNRSFRADLQWWLTFADEWNGVSVIPPGVSQVPVDVYLCSDAAGGWGCGAIHGRAWCQLQWPEGSERFHISFKELVPILMASLVWGRGWKGQKVMSYCDNEAVVHVLASRSAKDPDLMHLLRCLFFVEAAWQFTLFARHVKGKENVAADAISRNNLELFFEQCPHMDSLPTPVPLNFVKCLLDTTLDWTSPAWIRLFTSSLSLV